MTLDRQSFLVLNGVQTVSQTCQVLLEELRDIGAAGLSGVRLSPQDCGMVAVADIYRAVLDDEMDVGLGLARLSRIYPSARFSNGFHHNSEGAQWVQALRRA